MTSAPLTIFVRNAPVEPSLAMSIWATSIRICCWTQPLRPLGKSLWPRLSWQRWAELLRLKSCLAVFERDPMGWRDEGEWRLLYFNLCLYNIYIYIYIHIYIRMYIWLYAYINIHTICTQLFSILQCCQVVRTIGLVWVLNFLFWGSNVKFKTWLRCSPHFCVHLKLPAGLHLRWCVMRASSAMLQQNLDHHKDLECAAPSPVIQWRCVQGGMGWVLLDRAGLLADEKIGWSFWVWTDNYSLHLLAMWVWGEKEVFFWTCCEKLNPMLFRMLFRQVRQAGHMVGLYSWDDSWCVGHDRVVKVGHGFLASGRRFEEIPLKWFKWFTFHSCHQSFLLRSHVFWRQGQSYDSCDWVVPEVEEAIEALEGVRWEWPKLGQQVDEAGKKCI